MLQTSLRMLQTSLKITVRIVEWNTNKFKSLNIIEWEMDYKVDFRFKKKKTWDEIFKDYTIIFKNLSLYYNESYSSLSLDSLFQDIHQMRV